MGMVTVEELPHLARYSALLKRFPDCSCCNFSKNMTVASLVWGIHVWNEWVATYDNSY